MLGIFLVTCHTVRYKRRLSLSEMILRAASAGREGRAKAGQSWAGSTRVNWVGGADLCPNEHVDEAREGVGPGVTIKIGKRGRAGKSGRRTY